MRKQVDFAVHVATLGTTPGAFSSASFTQLIREQFKHFGDGWEIVGPVQFIQATADGISVLATFAKYEDEVVEYPPLALTGEAETKRGPGRPKKEDVA